MPSITTQSNMFVLIGLPKVCIVLPFLVFVDLDMHELVKALLWDLSLAVVQLVRDMDVSV